MVRPSLQNCLASEISNFMHAGCLEVNSKWLIILEQTNCQSLCMKSLIIQYCQKKEWLIIGEVSSHEIKTKVFT